MATKCRFVHIFFFIIFLRHWNAHQTISRVSQFPNSRKFINVTSRNKSCLFIGCLFICQSNLIWLKKLWNLGIRNSWSHVMNSSQVLFLISSFKIKTTNCSWLFFLCFSTSYWISFDWSTDCFESTFWLDISCSIWKKWIWKLY